MTLTSFTGQTANCARVHQIKNKEGYQLSKLVTTHWTTWHTYCTVLIVVEFVEGFQGDRMIVSRPRIAEDDHSKQQTQWTMLFW